MMNVKIYVIIPEHCEKKQISKKYIYKKYYNTMQTSIQFELKLHDYFWMLFSDANDSELIKRYVIPRRDVISQTWSRDIVADRSHQLQYSMRVLCAANTDSQCLTVK